LRATARAQEGQRLPERHLVARRLVRQAVELVADGGQLEPRQHGQQGLVIDAHHQAPPSNAW
jgi:hypothetical protein